MASASQEGMYKKGSAGVPPALHADSQTLNQLLYSDESELNDVWQYNDRLDVKVRLEGEIGLRYKLGTEQRSGGRGAVLLSSLPSRAWRAGRRACILFYLSEEFGGGVVPVDKVKEFADRFWREYADISELPEEVQVLYIKGALETIKNGGAITTPSLGVQYATETVSGLGTGGKAIVNSLASSGAALVTLGQTTEIELIPVTDEDRNSGYGTARILGAVSSEIGVGLLTGGASWFSNGGKAITYGGRVIGVLDATGNVIAIGKGSYDMLTSGEVNLSNGLQVAGGVSGLGGNMGGLLGSTGRYADDLVVNPKGAKSRGYDRPEIETKSGKAVKDTDATNDWDDFLGKDQTNIDPRDGLPDPDWIWSKDGKRSIRYGEHEMGSKPTKHHYHRETWHNDKVENVLQRVQQTKKK